MQSESQKTISVLLTKHTDVVSRILRFFTGCKYIHASIGLDDGKTFFSFNTKRGFCIEKPLKKKRNTPCILYQLNVSEQVYTDVASRIQRFINHAERYKYNFLGVLFCILRIPVRINNRYFCSQFVSELLISSGATPMRKSPSLYLPKDFSDEPQLNLFYQGTLSGIAELSYSTLRC